MFYFNTHQRIAIYNKMSDEWDVDEPVNNNTRKIVKRLLIRFVIIKNPKSFLWIKNDKKYPRFH